MNRRGIRLFNDKEKDGFVLKKSIVSSGVIFKINIAKWETLGKDQIIYLIGKANFRFCRKLTTA